MEKPQKWPKSMDRNDSSINPIVIGVIVLSFLSHPLKMDDRNDSSITPMNTFYASNHMIGVIVLSLSYT